MAVYVRIQSGAVFEVIGPLYYDSDAPEFVPVPVLDGSGEVVGETPRPADWPTYKAGDEIPIDLRFTPEFVALLVDVTDVVPMPDQGWLYSGGMFSEPVPAIPSMEERTAQRDALMAGASARIAPLQDAVDLEIATAEEIAALKSWKQYRVALSRLDLSAYPIAWPAQPA